MKVGIDQSVRSGHGRCNAAAPELIVLDENGYSDVTERDVPPGMEDEARLGVLNRPERCSTRVGGGT